MKWKKEKYSITTEVNDFDFDVIHDFLSNEAYWSKGIDLNTVKKSVSNSICFGLFNNENQIGFARMITDQATYGYLADVFIIEEFRGRGLSKWLMSCIISHPELQGLRRVTLATSNAHSLYSQFGFKSLNKPEVFMEINKQDIYQLKQS